MNAKYRAKDRRRLAGTSALAPSLAPSLALALALALALTVWLPAPAAVADDGNLTQQSSIEQQKSLFQLKLEQVQEQARRRAASRQRAPVMPADAASATDLGDANQSMRLDQIGVSDPRSPRIESDDVETFQARQAYERDQQRILDFQQRRRALTGGGRGGGVLGSDRYASKRSELQRFETQNRQQTLQRKLRR